MRASAVVTALLLCALAGIARAQPTSIALPRIGVLLFAPASTAVQEAFRQGLQDQGYVESRNILVEWRSAEGSAERAGALAAELVRLNVAVIVAEFTPAVLAARGVTSTIPIVMAPAGDPVASGLVKSLAHPGGNVTGFSNLAAELSGKRLDLIRESIPGLTRIGLLINGGDPLDKAFVDETRAAAASARIQVHVAPVPRPDQLEAALAALARERVGAVIVQGNLPVPPGQIAQSAARHGLATISLLPQFVEAGGLMSYGASLGDIQRRAAIYVDKILKGAKPADLPVEAPRKFELVVNLQTARRLGIAIPQPVLLRADRVIE